jgi:hypothetical protein
VIEYLDIYNQELAHQRQHGGLMLTYPQGRERPCEMCTECLVDKQTTASMHDIKRFYAWAVPNEDALKVIAYHSPRGVVEIGAGGGYWAMLLRERGVDVVAYDPDPIGTDEWHSGRQWSEVRKGDHTAVVDHPDRTLLLCWPSYAKAWTHQVVELFKGDTIIYVGEGSGGCTGDDRMHALLGAEVYCPHYDEPCTCDWPDPQFALDGAVDIPQWLGLHDRLHVYKRNTEAKGPAPR